MAPTLSACSACEILGEPERDAYGVSYLHDRLRSGAETPEFVMAAALIDVVAQLDMIRSALEVIALPRHTCDEEVP
jgi:hypothetical protein